MIAFAKALLLVLGGYVFAGLVFALPFALRGVNRIDPAARQSTWGFRLIVLPGVVAFWPLLALRWARGAPPAEEWNAHRRAG